MSIFTGCGVTSTGPMATGNNSYRISYTEGAFPTSSGRELLQKAILEGEDFCQNKNSTLQVLREYADQGPYILGNYPEADLTFKCSNNNDSIASSSPINNKYTKSRKAIVPYYQNKETNQLYSKSNGKNSSDLIKLLDQTNKVTESHTRWLFIVGIEDYEYTNSVKYSKDSANNFKKVMKKRLGIPEKNIRTLINQDATSAKINYNLKDMLRRIKSGDTVYFYYSGHGIPVPSQNNTPYLLAQDMNPSYIDDERFKLQTIYKQLSSSKASKVIAFIDSCFSGGTDNQQLIEGVAATRLKPKSVTFDNNKMLVISAGSGTQYSNKYDEKSNRLFSYYVMRGLINNNTDTQRLYDYVKSNVQEKSYEMGPSYEQVPVYDGNIGLEL